MAKETKKIVSGYVNLDIYLTIIALSRRAKISISSLVESLLDFAFKKIQEECGASPTEISKYVSQLEKEKREKSK